MSYIHSESDWTSHTHGMHNLAANVRQCAQALGNFKALRFQRLRLIPKEMLDEMGPHKNYSSARASGASPTSAFRSSATPNPMCRNLNLGHDALRQRPEMRSSTPGSGKAVSGLGALICLVGFSKDSTDSTALSDDGLLWLIRVPLFWTRRRS